MDGQLNIHHCSYGGLGDRHQQNGVNYTLDLTAGLTQVLADGTNTYLYGNGRIAQQTLTTEYFLPDALGSVRQLADPTGAVTLTQSYAPYGETVSSLGGGYSAYQYTGEAVDANGLTYLRARYYDPGDGRFTQRDPSGLEANLYVYARANPLIYTDASGLFSKELLINTLSLPGSSFSSLLDRPSYEDSKPWGFYATLLDAEVGDRLDTYVVDPLQRALGKQPGPILQKMNSFILGLGARDYGGRLDALPVITYNGSLATHYEGGAARYYHLMTPQGSQVYVDGVTATDYPDFVFYTFSYVDILKETVLSGALKKIAETGVLGKVLSCYSTAETRIVDRYGNVYISESDSLGVGATIGNLGVGWVSSYGKPFTLLDETTLKTRITGRSLDISVSTGLGFGTSFGSGNINTVSGGIQMSIGGALAQTRWLYQDSNRAWQEAIDAELGGPFAVYRKDVENRP